MAIALATLGGAGPAAGAGTALVGQWKLDENAGIVADDSSGYGNNGTLAGDATWIPGAFGSALRFDGSSGYVKVPDAPSLEPSTEVTVGAWIRHVGSPGSYRYIVAKGAAGCSAASYGLYTGPSGGLVFYVSRDHGAVYARSPDAGPGLWDGRWHLAVGTFDGQAIHLYLDGNQVGTGTDYPGSLEYPLSSSNDLFIGDYPGCPTENYAFVGDIDDVTLWSQALPQSAIKLMVQGDQTPPVPAGSPQPPQGSASPGQPPSSSGGAGSSPVLGSLLVAPSRFSPAGSAWASHGTGARISYTDSEPAQTTFKVLAGRQGIRVGGRCVARARYPRLRHATGCMSFAPVGQFTRSDVAGVNRFRFAGQIGGRSLRPGVYLLQATPRLSGRVGNTVSAAFRIV